MPWVALAPRAWPPPRPRLRLVKADPKNPYLSWDLAALQVEQASLESMQAVASANLKPLWAADLALLQEAISVKQPAVVPPAVPTPAPSTPNPYASLSPTHLEQAHAGLKADIADPQYAQHVPSLQQQLALVEQQMLATGLLKPPPVLTSVQQWEQLMDLAQAAAPKMQQALTDAFDWPKLPSGVQQSLVQGQVAQALGQMADFGMQQLTSSPP